MKRRTFVQASALMAGASLLPASHAQDDAFPSKPIRIVVPTSPGGALDAIARLYGERMSKMLKQPVLVENMAGAGTLMGVRHVAKSAPDGHTLLLSANTIVTLPFLDKNAGYSLSDFAGVADLSRSPLLLVVSSASNIKSMAQLVEAARKAPGAITYASVGIGSTTHLPVVMFARAANINLTLVPYKGTTLALPDIIAERVTFIMGNFPSVAELVNTGKLRALAVTSDSRSEQFPGVPTFRELGYPDAGYELFYTVLAPAGIPAKVRNILAEAVEFARKDPELQRKMKLQGQELSKMTTPEKVNAFLRQDEERMRKLIKEANIKAD